MDITYRPARENDTPLILQFIRELAEYEKLLHEVTATEETLRESLFGARAYAEVLFAEVENQPAGICLFFHNYSTFIGKPGIYIEDLFVRDAYRGHGIGKGFFLELTRIAQERGCGRIEWWVLDWNEPALEFYRKLGAVAMDEWVVMRLSSEKMALLLS